MRSRYPTGYGQITGRLKAYTGEQYAHRAAWVLNRGPITKDKPCVLHHCDNPACIRWTGKKHLFVGTNQDNMDDKVAKGRAPHGDQHPRVKLLDKEAVEMLQLYRTNQFNQKELAWMFSTSQKMSCLVVNMKGRFKFLGSL